MIHWSQCYQTLSYVSSLGDDVSILLSKGAELDMDTIRYQKGNVLTFTFKFVKITHPGS